MLFIYSYFTFSYLSLPVITVTNRTYPFPHRFNGAKMWKWNCEPGNGISLLWPIRLRLCIAVSTASAVVVLSGMPKSMQAKTALAFTVATCSYSCSDSCQWSAAAVTVAFRVHSKVFNCRLHRKFLGPVKCTHHLHVFRMRKRFRQHIALGTVIICK